MWITAFFVAVSVCTVVAYFAAIGIALQMWRRFERPSKLLLGGLLLLLLFSWFVGAVLPWFLFRVMAPDARASVSILISVGQSVAKLGALGLMVAAVYVDRKDRASQQADDFLPGDTRSAAEDANPFMSPK